MAITDSINIARQRNASDDQILQTIISQNPDKKASFDTAIQRGANSTKILDEIIKQNSGPATSALQTVQQPDTSAFGLLNQGLTGPGGYASGALKGLASGALGTVNLFQKGGQRILAGIDPTKTYEDLRKQSESTKLGQIIAGKDEDVNELLKAKTKEEKIGKGAEFVAEFLLPSSKVAQSKVVTEGLKNVSESLINMATRRGGQALRQDLRREFPIVGEQLPSFARQYLDNAGKFFGTVKGGIETSTKVLRQTIKKFTEIEKGAVGKTPIKFDDLANSIRNNWNKISPYIPDSEDKAKIVKLLSNKTLDTIDWATGHQIKTILPKLVPKPTFGGESRIAPSTQNILNSLTTLGKRLSTAAKGTDYDKLNLTYSLYSQVRKQLIRSSSPSSSGGAFGQIVDTALKVLKPVAQTLNNPGVEIGAAKTLDLIRKGIEKSKKIF